MTGQSESWWARFRKKKVRETKAEGTLVMPTKTSDWFTVALAQIRKRQGTLQEIRSRYKSLTPEQSLLMVGLALDELVGLIDSAPPGYENEDLSRFIDEELRMWAMLQEEFKHRHHEQKRLVASKALEVSPRTIHAMEKEIELSSAHIKQLTEEIAHILASESANLLTMRKRPPSTSTASA